MANGLGGVFRGRRLETLIEPEDGLGAKRKYTLDTAARKLTIRSLVRQLVSSRGIVVLGMHRSGTSALSGILQLLGFDLGADLMGPNEFNPTGYWENQQFVRLNERVLSHLGTSWSDVFMLPFRLDRTNLREVFSGEAKSLLEKAFSGKRPWVLKDPRLSMLIDFWLPYLAERDVSFIHVIRDPVEVADSLARRNGFPRERSLLLWFLQNLNAEFFTRGLNRCFINYEDYVRDWRGSLGTALAQLGLKPLRSFDQAAGDVEKFITKGRVRPQVAVARPSPAIGCDLVKEAFETLRDAGRFPEHRVEDRCDRLMSRFRDSADLVLRALAENDIRAELEAARKQISVLSAKELALKGKVAELQKRKMLLTERDSFRVREFLSAGVWRFWWLWLPISLIPIWIFD
jgi:hypothetical protein